MHKRSGLVNDQQATSPAIAWGTGVLLTLLLVWSIFLEVSSIDDFSETIDWEIDEGDYDFLEVECLANDCNTEITFTQAEYGEISVFLVEKSEFLSYQSCSDYSVVGDFNISGKASHVFDTGVIKSGTFYLLIDYNHCSENSSETGNNSTGTATFSTEGRGFFERLFN